MRPKVFVVLGTVIIGEIGVFFLASQLSEIDTVQYQLAARYSARISFAIIVLMLAWTGLAGLKRIYSKETSRELLMLSLLTFAVNHLIHFIFIVLNFRANGWSLLQARNGFGSIGYVLLSLAPLYLWKRKELNRSLHAQIGAFLLVVLSIFFITYFGRLSKQVPLSSPLLFYKVCLIFIAVIFLLNVYRFLADRRKLV